MRVASGVVAGAVALAFAVGGAAAQRGDRGWARTIVLKRSDLPAGWARAAAQSGSGAGCVKPSLAGIRTTAHSASRFSRRLDSASVASTVRVVATAAQARTVYTRVAHYPYASCFAKLAKQELAGKPVTVDRVTSSAPRFARLGDRAAQRRVTIAFKAGTFTLTSTFDLVFIQRGRAVTATVFASIGSPFAAGFERAVVRRLAARMRPR